MNSTQRYYKASAFLFFYNPSVTIILNTFRYLKRLSVWLLYVFELVSSTGYDVIVGTALEMNTDFSSNKYFLLRDSDEHKNVHESARSREEERRKEVS